MCAGIGIGEGVLDDDEGTGGERFAHALLVGQRMRRVGAGDPQRLDLAAPYRLEQLHRHQAGLCRDRRDAPEVGHFGPVGRILQVAVRRQQVGHGADFAPAHGVRLAGQRERAHARPADLAGGQMQVDQRRRVGRAVPRLVQPLAPERQRRRRLAEPARRLQDVGGRHLADTGGDLGRHAAQLFEQGGIAFGVAGNVGRVDQPLGGQHLQHGGEQVEVGARRDLQVQVGHCRGIGAARIDDDDLQVGPCLARRLDAAEQDGMGECRVGAADEEQVGQIDVLIAARHAVHAQRRLVAGDGRRHAEAGVGIDVVGANQRARQLVEDVVVLGQQLAGNVEGHRIRAVLADCLGETAGRLVERRVPTQRLQRRGALRAPQRLDETAVELDGPVQVGALGAQLAEVGRVLGIAAHAGDAAGAMADDDAAAGTAVGAGGAGFLLRFLVHFQSHAILHRSVAAQPWPPAASCDSAWA